MARAIVYDENVEESGDIRSDEDITSLNLNQKLSLLEKTMQKKVIKWWEASSFKSYIKVNRVPRGLRIVIVLTY